MYWGYRTFWGLTNGQGGNSRSYRDLAPDRGLAQGAYPQLSWNLLISHVHPSGILRHMYEYGLGTQQWLGRMHTMEVSHTQYDRAPCAL